MDKFSFITLWDRYRGLLTSTQQEITDMYFNLDLTVSEIAEQKGISRQAVSDCLSISKKQLEEWEDKLKLCALLNEISLDESFRMTDVLKWAEDFKNKHPQLAEETEELLAILDKDYSAEIKKSR